MRREAPRGRAPPVSSAPTACLLVTLAAILEVSCTGPPTSGHGDGGDGPGFHLFVPATSAPSTLTEFALSREHDFNTGAPKVGPDPACAGGLAAVSPYPPPPLAWQAYLPGTAKKSDLGLQPMGASLLVATSSTELYQLDRRTGAYVWDTDAWYGSGLDDSSLAVGTDGLLYLFAPDLLAVDLRRHRVVRGIANGSFVVPPVAIGGGSVLIRDYFGTVLRLDPKPGTNTYEVAWAVEEPGGAGQGMHLLYDAKRRLVYAQVLGDDTHPGATVALRVRSGAVAWTAPWSGGELGFFGPGFLLRASRRPDDLTGSAVHVQLLDRDTGAVRYDYAPAPTADEIRWAAGDRTGDRVYVTSESWVQQSTSLPVARTTVTALDGHLKPLWTWKTPKATAPYDDQVGYDSTVTSRPVVGDDGSVYLTTMDCHVWALDRDGNVLWADHHPYPFRFGRAVLYRGRYYAMSTLWHLPPVDPNVPASLVRAYRVSPMATTGPVRP